MCKDKEHFYIRLSCHTLSLWGYETLSIFLLTEYTQTATITDKPLRARDARNSRHICLALLYSSHYPAQCFTTSSFPFSPFRFCIFTERPWMELACTKATRCHNAARKVSECCCRGVCVRVCVMNSTSLLSGFQHVWNFSASAFKCSPCLSFGLLYHITTVAFQYFYSTYSRCVFCRTVHSRESGTQRLSGVWWLF